MGTFPEARAHALQRSAPLKHCTSSGFALLCDSQHRHRKAEATARFSASNWSINSGTSGTFPSDAAEFLASLHDMSLIGLSDRYTLWRVRTSPEFDCTEFTSWKARGYKSAACPTKYTTSNCNACDIGLCNVADSTSPVKAVYAASFGGWDRYT